MRVESSDNGARFNSFTVVSRSALIIAENRQPMENPISTAGWSRNNVFDFYSNR